MVVRVVIIGIAAAARVEAVPGIWRAKNDRQPDSAPHGGRSRRQSARLIATNTAFSRVVRRAYDYRCAACGLRVVLEGGLYIVDAAHLIPFAETHDDDPRNGMALCKNHHWAMDRYLIAPGTDRVWHVTTSLDDRIEGQRDLIRLDGRSILLPHEPRYHPKDSALR